MSQIDEIAHLDQLSVAPVFLLTGVGTLLNGGGSANEVRRTFDNYQRSFGSEVSKSCFFGSGLTHDAIAAACG